MIRVSIDLLPLGGELGKRSLGTMEIELIGEPGSAVAQTQGRIGDYRYRIFKWTKKKELWKSGTVTGHQRKKLGPWDLLCQCLVVAVGDRVKDGLRRGQVSDGQTENIPRAGLDAVGIDGGR